MEQQATEKPVIMDYLTLLLLISSLVATIHILISNLTSKSSKKLPPGPRSLPIIGNILELGTQPHQALAKLSQIHGPIISLQLGRITTVVISSPELAKEFLHKHDLSFSTRTVPDSLRTYDHHELSVAWLPPSAPQWRILRKACATRVFSNQQLDATQICRRKEVQNLLDYVEEKCREKEALDIGEVAFTTILNSMSNTFFSMDLAHYTSNKTQEFKEIIWGIMEEAGRPNIVDFFPIFRGIDPQGIRKRANKYFGKLFKLIDGFVEERLCSGASKMDSKASKDVLDSMLELMIEDASQMSRPHLVHLFVDLFVAGVDTTSSTIEWAMAELLHNPEKLAKARIELNHVLDKDEQLDESKFLKLPFLRAVVKETFRLHPPTPLLLPRKSKENIKLYGFLVPKNAQILVNTWAMGRDSRIWSNPNQFLPERFLENKIDFKGNNFELIPFGAGRRICSGLPLASRTIHIVLASLIRSYDWKLANGMKAEEMDMGDKFGITLHRAQPLLVTPNKVQ